MGPCFKDLLGRVGKAVGRAEDKAEALPMLLGLCFKDLLGRVGKVAGKAVDKAEA